MFSALEISAVTVELQDSGVAIVPFAILLFIGLIIFVPAALFRRWYFYRRRIKRNVITAEYAPPAGFNPAEIGYMFDGKLREREVGATIIHLIKQGYMHIKKTEDGTKRIFAGPRVGEDLKVYEKKLIAEADIEEGATADQLIRRFSNIKSDKDGAGVAGKTFVFTQLVHTDLQRRQYVKGSALYSFIIGSLKVQLALVFITLYIPFALLWGLIALQDGATDFAALGMMMLMAVLMSIVMFPPYFLASVILNYFRGRIVGREWIITAKLKHLWPQIVGYRQYVQLVESEKLEFNSKDLESVIKNDTLPYAVALGFVKNWKDIIS